MSVSTGSVHQTEKHILEDGTWLGLLDAEANFLVVVVPVLMLLFFFEHKRQLKKFKKIWKEKLEASLVTLRDSHRKRMDEFKVQPFSMKAEWGTLRGDVEKRLEDLRNLKVEVNTQLTSLKLEFQTQLSALQRSLKPGKLDQPESLDMKLASFYAIMDAKLLATVKHVDEQIRMYLIPQQLQNEPKQTRGALDDEGGCEPKLQNGRCD